MLEINKIHQMDVREGLNRLDNESIDMAITSPPYWALRDYKSTPLIYDGDENCEHKWVTLPPRRKWGKVEFLNGKKQETHSGAVDNISAMEKESDFCSKCGAWKGQLGLEPTFDLYIKHLCDIFDQVKRVLKKSGSLWVNLGDTYGSGTGEGGSLLGRDKNPDIKQWGNKPIKGYEKSLLQIPSRFAIEMSNRGWILRNEIIWYKPNCMPSSAKDRFTLDFEKIFFFVKNKKYYFEQQFEDLSNPERTNFTSGSRSFGENKDRNDNDLGQRSKEFSFPLGRNKRTVWEVDDKPYAVQERDKEFIEYRNLLPLEEIKDYLNEWRKKKGLTIEEIETTLNSQAPHHWFNGESYPTKDDWLRIKELLGFDDKYDKEMIEVFIKSSEKQNYPQGRNKRTTWKIPTSPFPEAHFAVYPEELIKTPIIAGCPEFICKKCGKPREKIYESLGGKDYSKNSGYKRQINTEHELEKFNRNSYEMETVEKEFKGLSNCKCNAGFNRGIVLDPFIGSGTTAKVAKHLGRNYIGFEINKDYIKIANKRIAQKTLWECPQNPTPKNHLKVSDNSRGV